MNILGIETSCDETSVAILKNNRVAVNLISSQIFHRQYGGVVPEYASREHIRVIQTMTGEALSQAQLGHADIDAVAVTRGPGLMGALLVGLSFAKGYAYAMGKPLLGINHIEGHIYANFLDYPELDYPFLCLLVSGGHTQIIRVRDFQNYEVLGRSQDDAAGEAFDKAARILGLGYPGGPLIDRTSRGGDPKFHHFPRAKLKGSEYDFSFSGLKTSILYLVRRQGADWAQKNLLHLCASYQEAIVEVLLVNAFRAVKETAINRLVLAGGVAANTRLRERFQAQARSAGVQIYFPSLEYCTDNAAMIARVGVELWQRKQASDFSISAIPNLKLPTQTR